MTHESTTSPDPSVQEGVDVRMQSPRLLILLWCVWLLGSWSVTLGIESLALAARLMVYACVFGLMLLWPAFRLTQVGRAEHAPLRIVALDWFCLILVLQTVIWSLRVSGEWGVMQTLSIDMAVASWSWLTAGLIGLGLVSGRRTLVMMACAVLLVTEPVAMLWSWTAPPLLYPRHGQWQVWLMVMVPIWIAGALVWRAAWRMGRQGAGGRGPGSGRLTMRL